MDRTSIIVIAVCLGILGLWSFVLMPKLYPYKPVPRSNTNAATTLTATNQTPLSNVLVPVPSAEAPLSAPIVTADVAEQVEVLTNEVARYTFSSHGGGLKLVELLQYPETVSTRREKRSQTNEVATLNTYTRIPTLALLDGVAVQGDGLFALTKTGDSVRAEKLLTNGLGIVKEFQLSSNYLVNATVRLENRSPQPLGLPPQEWFVGTASPMGALDRGDAVGVMWYNGAKTEDISGPWFANRTLGCIPGVPRTEYRGGASNVVWAAVHNQFFALAAMPAQPAEAVVVRKLDLPRPTGEEARLVATNGALPQGYAAAFVYPALTLAPKESLERRISLYAGPKEYRTLAVLSERFSNLDQIMSFGTFGFVSKGLLLGMNFLHHQLKFTYGWSIVAITVIIKLVFWPLTRASTRSMKRMQALQPEIKLLQEKYKDEPQKLSQKQWEFWKKNKVNPMGSCLPMLLQIPVFFGFLQMIRSAIELRGAPFLWAGDLSKPDTLFVIPNLGFIPFGIGIPGQGLPFNLLPLLMGATMLWQARLTPPSPGMDPTQQKIMKYLPLIFLVGLYNFSAAMTLYWTINNLLTILQTKLTNAAPAAPAPKAPVLTAPLKKKK